MKGVVYLIGTIARPGGELVKIGWTGGWASQRMRQLQVACADLLTVLGEIEGRPGDERTLHARFSGLHHRGEWFILSEPLTSYIASLAARSEIGGLV